MQRYVPLEPASQVLTILVWIEPHPDLPLDATLRGCEIWAPKGVVCAEARDPSTADIRVYADPRCIRKENGRRTLATAYQGGRIVMRTACFRDGATYDLHAYTAVFGHEVGHQLGIWEHVPERCGPSRGHDATDAQICGEAIMNPYYDKDVHFMTPIDALAFDARNRGFAVVEHDGWTGHVRPRDDDEPICTFDDI